MIVDSHCHASPLWFEPVESLLHEMDHNGVDRAVLVQIATEYDNAYQQDCARRYADRLVSVVGLADAGPAGCQTLERLAEDGAVGVRLGADVRSPGDDPWAIWRTADRLGLAVSCHLGQAEPAPHIMLRPDPASAPEAPTRPARQGITDVADVARALPTLKIVIEHFTARSATGGVDDADRPQALALARYPNIFIKVTGLGEFAERPRSGRGSVPFAEQVPSNLEDAYRAFGAERMMWGSDFPPVAGREGYANALRFCRNRFEGKPTADQARIFGEVADAVFARRTT